MNNKLTAKTLSALEAVASAGAPVGFKDLALRLGLPPSTLSRILSDLSEAGYIKKSGPRHFEPALGLIALGQMATLNGCFPKKAVRLVHARCKASGFIGSVAGLFRDRLVYLCRGHLPGDSSRAPGLPFTSHPHGSNIAVAILARRCGKALALAQLEESIRRNEPSLSVEERMAFFSKRIDEFLSEGHSTWIGSDFANCAVPIDWQGETWGLSLISGQLSHAAILRLRKEAGSLADSLGEMLLN